MIIFLDRLASITSPYFSYFALQMFFGLTNVARGPVRLCGEKELIANQQKQMEALTNTVRKIHERVELSAPALQTAANED